MPRQARAPTKLPVVEEYPDPPEGAELVFDPLMSSLPESSPRRFDQATFNKQGGYDQFARQFPEPNRPLSTLDKATQIPSYLRTFATEALDPYSAMGSDSQLRVPPAISGMGQMLKEQLMGRGSAAIANGIQAIMSQFKRTGSEDIQTRAEGYGQLASPFVIPAAAAGRVGTLAGKVAGAAERFMSAPPAPPGTGGQFMTGSPPSAGVVGGRLMANNVPRGTSSSPAQMRSGPAQSQIGAGGGPVVTPPPSAPLPPQGLLTGGETAPIDVNYSMKAGQQPGSGVPRPMPPTSGRALPPPSQPLLQAPKPGIPMPAGELPPEPYSPWAAPPEYIVGRGFNPKNRGQMGRIPTGMIDQKVLQEHIRAKAALDAELAKKAAQAPSAPPKKPTHKTPSSK